MVQTVQRLMETPQLLVDKVVDFHVDIPVVTQTLIPVVLVTMEILQLLFDMLCRSSEFHRSQS